MDLLYNIDSAYPDVLLQMPVHININISEFLVRRKVLVSFLFYMFWEGAALES